MIGNSRIEKGGPVDIQTWRMVAKGTTLIPCIVYPLLIFVPMRSRQLTAPLGVSFGPDLAIASIRLEHFLYQNKRAVSIATRGDL